MRVVSACSGGGPEKGFQLVSNFSWTRGNDVARNADHTVTAIEDLVENGDQTVTTPQDESGIATLRHASSLI